MPDLGDEQAETEPAPTLGAGTAAIALAVLCVASPWPMGGAPEWASRAASLLATGVAVVALTELLRRPGQGVSLSPFAPLYALAILGYLQLLPLPPILHRWLAPGSHALWHPAERAAAAVLGSGPRPLSVLPAATAGEVAWVLGLAALATVARPTLQRVRWARGVTVAVIAGGLGVAVYGIVARFAYGPLLFGSIAVPTVSPFGPFVSKNHFAGYVSAVALLSLGFAVGLGDAARRDAAWLSWVRSPRAPRVVLAFGAALVLVLAVLVAQSRGGAVGLAVGGAAFLALRLSRGRELSPRRTLLGLLLGVAVSLLVLLLLPSEARSRLGTLASAPDRSGSFRLDLWTDAFAAVRASPLLGHGLGAFADALPPHKTGAGELRVEHAENDWLEMLVEGGLPAAGLVAWGLALAFRWSRRAARGHGLERGLALGAAAAVVGLSFHSLVDFPLRLPAGASVAVLAATLLAALGERAPAGAALSRPVAIALLAALLASAVPAVFGPLSPLRAESLSAVRLAIHGGGHGPTPSRARAAEGQLRQHLRSRPGDAEGWALLAWLRARAGAREEATALARHATALDPKREALSSYARGLEATLTTP